jgi:hypothetical protein
MTTRQPPRFYGINTYSDPQGRFQMRYPSTWQYFPVEDNSGARVDGAMYMPNLDDQATSLSVWVKDLEHSIVAEDLNDLRQGVEEGLAQFTDCRVEATADVVLSNLIKFEREFVYRHGDGQRKRKFWMLYVDRWLIVVTYQGSSLEEYDHWFAMANYSFATFYLPEALWFATDRDLVGHAHPQT